MFKFLSLFVRPTQDQVDGRRSDNFDSSQHHAPLYCAARNVYLTAGTVFTALDADRLFRALSELRNLAVALRSPAADLAEITGWRDTVGARAAQLRDRPAGEERSPDVAPLDVFISKGVIERERKRRASA